MSKPLDLLIFGTGAVGSTFGWRAAQNPSVKLTTLCRSNYDIVKNQGIRFRSTLWGDGFLSPSRVVRHPNEISGVKFDYVVCATKNNPHEEASLLGSLRPLMSINTSLVILQNGAETEHSFRRAFPSHTVLSSICYASCTMNGGGFVTQPANIRPHGFHIGIHSNGSSNPVEDMKRLRTLAGLDSKFKAVDNIATERWSKMAFNGAWNPTTALFGLDTQGILQDSPAGVSLVRQLATEVKEVAHRYGAKLPRDYEEEIIRTAAVTPPIVPSMLQDSRLRRQMEVEAICGTVCRMAEKTGVPHPAMAATYRILLDMNQSFMAPPESFLYGHIIRKGEVNAAETAMLSQNVCH